MEPSSKGVYFLRDAISDTLLAFAGARYAYAMNHIYNHRDIALAYHHRLPERIRTYLAQQGIVDPILCRYRIGWDGTRIVIPITDRERRVTFFRLIKDPLDHTSSPEVVSWPEMPPEVFGWERLVAQREGLVICMGIMNRLILETFGIASLTTTDDLATFSEDAIRTLGRIETIFVALSAAEATDEVLDRLTSAIPHARLVSPESLGPGGIFEFLVHSNHSRQDFEHLCALAVPLLRRAVGSDAPRYHA